MANATLVFAAVKAVGAALDASSRMSPLPVVKTVHRRVLDIGSKANANVLKSRL